MSNPSNEKDTSETAIDSDEQSSFSGQPLAGRPQQHPTNPTNNKPEISNYKPDALESLRFDQRAIIFGVTLFALIWVSFFSGWITDKTTEFFVTSLLSLTVLLVVIGQAYISKRQWYAMQVAIDRTDQMIDQNERSMMYSQAAYVMVKSLIFEDYILGKRPTATVGFHNTGTTPAYDVRIYPNLDYKTSPFSFTHDEAKDMSETGGREDLAYPIILGPNGDCATQMVFSPDPLTIDLLELEKREPLHIWGIITYTDIFGRDRWTEFCYRKYILGEIPPGQYSLGMNETHNDADKPYAEKKQRQSPN